jgi:hypothetical protein
MILVPPMRVCIARETLLNADIRWQKAWMPCNFKAGT